MKLKAIIIITLALFTFSLHAQKLSTSSRKAKNYYEEASSHLTYGQYYEANEKLQKAIKNDPLFIEAYLLLGDLNTDTQEIETAIRYYKKAIEINPEFYANAHYFVARLLIGIGDYKEAEKSFYAFLKFPDLDEFSKNDAEKNILNCQFALTAIQNPVDFQPINLGKNINSSYSEYFPTMTVDGKFILYTRRLGEEGRHQQEDFYVSIKGSGKEWVAAQNMGESINTHLNEGAASISADGKTIIFTACDQNGFYGPNRSGYGSCDLFFTRRVGKQWSKAINLGPPVNSANWESQPSLSADGETLYFVRGVRRGTRRESDIMVTHLDKEGYWTKPEKLPATINTNEAEESVMIHPDNRTIYFSSRGKIGMGGSDIFMSRKGLDGEWIEAINLGYPINTHKDENSILVGPDGEIGYFASDRKGGFGGLDIYAFEMPEEIKADPVTYFKGVVYDSLTRQLLAAEIELIDMELGETINTSFSEASSGQFFLTLTPRHNYMINVSKNGYLFYSGSIFIKDNNNLMEPYEKDVPLLPIQIGSSIVLKNIFFELDKSDLKQESHSELTKLTEFLEKNASISIEIAGHTDKQGTHEYNLNLSENRAKAVFNYLIDKGISEARLTYKGYSFDMPLADNDTEEGRALNRRTEFVIIKK